MNSRPHRCDIAVVGSGFAGSLMAMAASRLGFFTTLLERGSHPRFVIGESSTPLANLLLEEIATDYHLPFVRPLSKWGTWQKSAPQLACGLKRGFTFYVHELGRPFRPDPELQRQLLVGASPDEQVADTHWYRPEFDYFLVQQAQATGVAYWDRVELIGVAERADGIQLSGNRQGERLNWTAQFLIDATGPRGCLHHALGLPEESFATLPPTQALFSHFAGVAPLPNCFRAPGRTEPYPPEQAAVHHIFPGGWVWVLKFNNGITSAGVAATDPVANKLDFRSGEPAWRRLLDRLPSLAEMFAPAQPVFPFIHQPRLPFKSGQIAGRSWLLLPSAAGVIDPLLSTGFPLALLGISRIACLLANHWQRDSFAARLNEYAQLTALELDTTAQLIGALYAAMDRFELFQDLSLLYFAAASFSEFARRLGRPRLADSFLLCRHPVFSQQLRRICATVHQPASPGKCDQLRRSIQEAIAPFDVIGLTDRSRHPWYPALAADFARAASSFDAGNTLTTWPSVLAI